LISHDGNRERLLQVSDLSQEKAKKEKKKENKYIKTPGIDRGNNSQFYKCIFLRECWNLTGFNPDVSTRHAESQQTVGSPIRELGREWRTAGNPPPLHSSWLVELISRGFHHCLHSIGSFG
jgi:hypothetical protein